MRKFSTLSLAVLLSSSFCQAQLMNKILPANAYTTSLSTVVEDFQNNYHQIQGVSLPADEDRDIFASTVQLPGTAKCVIYRFHSEEDTTASWQAILYSGEDYKEAVKTYRNGFKQLKQTKFKDGMNRVSFDGELQDPKEELRFTSSILRPSGASELYKNFVAEIEILNSIDGWTVQLNLHSRKPDTERYQ